jgi:hypothetical protein
MFKRHLKWGEGITLETRKGPFHLFFPLLFKHIISELDIVRAMCASMKHLRSSEARRISTSVPQAA